MFVRTFIALVTCSTFLCADTLVFKRGGSVDGQFVGGDNRSVRFVVGNQVNVYNISDIVSIRFNDAGQPTASANPYGPPASNYPPPAPYPSSNYPPPGSSSYPASNSSNYPPQTPTQQTSAVYPPPSADSSSSAQNNPYPPPETSSQSSSAAPAPLGVEIAPDTPITVRMIDPINSTTDQLGKTYRASVDEPVMVNGATAIPRGADAVVALVASQQAGKIEGQTQLTLALKSVTVNGTTYQVKSSRATQAAASRSRRSAEMIGGGAALGAVIGAIAGGGKGAAIGAVAGGGAGTAATVMTSGDTVKVPAETRLVFTLQNPLDL